MKVYDFEAIHPDPSIARNMVIEDLEGKLVEAQRALIRGLDYRAATPEGLSIKHDLRDALRRTGCQESEWGVCGT